MLSECLQEFNKLGKKEEVFECLECLKTNDPRAYLLSLRSLGQAFEKPQFCYEQRETVENFTLYTIGYLEPYIDELTSYSKLK